MKPSTGVRFAPPEPDFQRDGLMVSRLVRGEESASSTLAALTNARVAHLAERTLDKREVSGSSPGTCTVAVAEWIRRRAVTPSTRVQFSPATQIAAGCGAAEARLIWDQKVGVSTTPTPTTGSYVNGRLAVLQTANEGSIPSGSTNGKRAGRRPVSKTSPAEFEPLVSRNGE